MEPIFKGLVDAFVAEANKQGLRVAIFMGLRTFSEQDALYALGRTVKNPDGIRPDRPMGMTVTKAKGGESWHCYGLAADIIFKDVQGRWSWADNWPWERLGRLGESMGVQWGNIMGEDRMEKWDRPHYQMNNGLLIPQARALYDKGGMQAVWDEVARRKS